LSRIGAGGAESGVPARPRRRRFAGGFACGNNDLPAVGRRGGRQPL